MRWPTLVAFVLALAVGGLCLVHGLGFMAGFNTAPLPALVELAKRPPPFERVLDRGNVYLVVVDGMRADFADRLALKVPADVPMSTCQIEALLPSFSRPAYVALLTGVPPWASGVHTNDHEGAVALPSVFAAARRAGVLTHAWADGTYWWTSLFPEDFDRVTILPKPDFEREWSAMHQPPRGAGVLVLFHIVDPDDDAHDYGVGADYEAALAEAGKKIQRLLKRLGPDDTLFVTADHGHIARGGHGGPEPEVMAVPFIAFGAGVVPFQGGEHAWCGSLIDVPATIAARLGISPPATSLGSVLPIVEPRGEAFGARLAAQSLAVHDALGEHAIDALAQGRTRLGSLRGGLLAGLLWIVLALVVARLLVVGHALTSLITALVPSALAVLVYLVMEPTLSLSAVWLKGPWTLRIAALAGCVSVLSCLFAYRRHAPAEALALLTIGALLPWLVAVTVHGSASAGPLLGDPHAAFAIVVADVFAAVLCVVALLAAGIGIVRDRARARAKVWV